MRAALLRRATNLAWFTLAWNVGECVSSVTAAWLAGSRALAGFGLDSAVESVSAGVLVWRLRAERSHRAWAERAEGFAVRAIGYSFLLLAGVVSVEAVRALASRNEPESSALGIAVTLMATVVMPVLARKKHRVAVALNSRAVEADSVQTRACMFLSLTVLVGLALNAAFGWWWADPVAALGVAVFLLVEGREVLKVPDATGPFALPGRRTGSHAGTMKTAHRRLALFTGINAIAAWAGAAGLITGYLALGPEIDARLPFDSPVVGGVALALVVAVPLSVVTALAWKDRAATAASASVCGALLVGWIAVQLMVIRELSFFHPLYFLIGAGLTVWGWSHREPTRQRPARRLQHAMEDIAEAIDPLVNRPQGR